MTRNPKTSTPLNPRPPHATRHPHLGFIQIGLCCLLLVSACQASPAALVNRAVLTQAPMQGLPSPTPELLSIPTHTAEITPASSETPIGKLAATAAPIASPTPAAYSYQAQAGDTLALVAQRFTIPIQSIQAPEILPEQGFLSPGTILWLPLETAPAETVPLLPDSEIIYGPSAIDFSLTESLAEAGGALGIHQEYLESDHWASAADIITRVALENSINPRILASILEYTCGCVSGPASSGLEQGYALEVQDFRYKSLYGQLWWAANQLSTGYYGWREGWLSEIKLPDGSRWVLSPDSNAGSVALQYFFAQYWAAHDLASKMGPETWAEMDLDPFGAAEFQQALDPQSGLAAVHQRLFGDAWKRANVVEPLLPGGLKQPQMSLPFEPEQVWSFTSGPHTVWERQGAQAAIDFAPASNEAGCLPSDAWVTAVADGPVVRVASGLVVQDINGTGPADGLEQSGWAVLYMHIASRERVAPGTYLHEGDRIGHPSCEGGPATGTHLHIARKYNGEWMAASGTLPFVLSGWTVQAGEGAYQGSLTKGNQVVTANLYAIRSSQITRLPEPTPEVPGE